ncbi:gluconate 2-dehydrogenase subunit 3 family protein [Pseudomonadota bacterium]
MSQRGITRRVFIGASLYVVAVPLFASALNKQLSLIRIEQDGRYFKAEQLTILTDVAEIMIPKTTTPGATDADVIPVLDSLMLTWAGTRTKEQFNYLINQIKIIANEAFANNYLLLPLENRIAIIDKLDTQAFSEQSTTFAKSYRKLKKTIFHIFYSSKEANPDFSLIPGGYKGDLTKSEFTKIQARGYL